MPPQRCQQIRDVLDAVEATPEDGRAAVLDRLCETDPHLRREVDHLLSGSDTTANAIHDAVAEQAESWRRDSDGVRSSGIQERFGPYQVVRKIGTGGMGAVYEALRV